MPVFRMMFSVNRYIRICRWSQRSLVTCCLKIRLFMVVIRSLGMSCNVIVETDVAGNIKATKAKSPEKTDDIVAAIMLWIGLVETKVLWEANMINEVS